MSKRSSRYMKSSFGSPNSGSGWQSYAFRKITRWAGLGLDTLDVGRPRFRSGDVDKCPKATKLGPRPLRSLGRQWEVLLTPEDPGPCQAIAHGVGQWPSSTKPPLPATAMSPIHVLGHMEHICNNLGFCATQKYELFKFFSYNVCYM
jgi:hypothetical protein